MRKFKLIKEYPGSKALGTILQPNDSLQHDFCEKYSEYWQEIKEGNYQIMSFTATNRWSGKVATLLPNGHYSTNPDDNYGWTLREMLEILSYVAKDNPKMITLKRRGAHLHKEYWKIHSVKRLSDGEIFTVGDIISCKNGSSNKKLNGIKLVNDDSSYANGIWFHYSSGCSHFKHAIKEKQPIFLTHDGKDIFEGDKVIWVNKDSLYHDTFTATAEVKFCSDLNAYFISAVDAQNYINKNTPIFTTQDGVRIKKDEIVYVVDGGLTSIDMISNFVPQDYPTRKAFSTSKAAQDYIVENKYALSIKEFWEFASWGGSSVAKSKRLKRLVKQRIGI
jgi:hypothetical protein